MSRPLAIPVMVFLSILAHAAALPNSPTPTALPLANSNHSSELAASGLLHLRVKHGPIEGASSIQVTVKNIQVQKQEAPKGLDWISVIRGEKTFDLVGSEQGEEVLAGKMLAEGLYSRVQLDLVSVKVTLKGQQKPATVTGNRIKEVRAFDIDMAKVCILTLDFDVARSLVVADSGEIRFKPVVRFLVRRGSPG